MQYLQERTHTHTHSSFSLCCAQLFGRSRNEAAKFVRLATREKVRRGGGEEKQECGKDE